MKVCNVHGCPELHDGPGGRCPTHRAQADRARGTSHTRGYNTPGHRAFRAAVLKRDPICVTPGCLAWSTVADHHPRDRRTLVALGLNPNDPDFGRGLCATHHNQWTAQSNPGGWAEHTFE